MTRVEPIRDKELIQEIKEYLNENNERNYIMFLIGIHTGFRISDILTLRVKDVLGWDIRLFEQKTKKYRNVKMPNELKRAIRKYVEGKNKYEFLIKSRKGKNKPIGRKQAYKILKEVADEFGLEHIGTHSLRKTYGYQHYKAFKDIAALQKELNHTDPRETKIYIGIEQDQSNAYQSKISW
ncbi:tyrosine-type recombinase/integrase [Lysinibacillus pakistanensis]|uniref:Tyrosine-type recombinase/integrase n=1 Tax=Lysinibacillus pakistanensis TaxID=759811 RepID=A0ABX6DF37_9BACI|nr:tyrosine-type recombinase/integrase [Lysinibacillus pakistanensis]